MANDNKRRAQGVENDYRNMLYTELKRTGGDPSFLFEILEGIMQDRAWEYLLDDRGEPVGSLRRLIEEPLPVGCGQDADKVLKLLDIEHRYEEKSTERRERMNNLRRDVRKQLEMSLPKLNDNGGDRLSENSITCNTEKITQQGNSKAYRIARLKRDAPDIAERVIEGDLSAAAGMRELRKRNGEPEYTRRSVNLVNAESARDTLTNHMPHDVLDELIDLLIEWRNEND